MNAKKNTGKSQPPKTQAKQVRRNRKPRVKKVVKQQPPAQIERQSVTAVTTRGTDPRAEMPLPFSRAASPSGMSNCVVYPCVPSGQSVINFAVGYVLHLVEIGYNYTPGVILDSIAASYPYFLTQFIVNQILLSMKGEILTITRCPYGLLTVFRSLNPTRSSYKTGEISYTWDTSNIDNLTVSTYATGGGANCPLGYATSVSTNSEGYPRIADPMPYSPENGLSAWNRMIQFLSDRESCMLQVVDVTTKTGFEYDASAFSTVYAQIGDNGQTAGYTTQLFNPSKIKSPLYAVWNPYTSENLVTSESRICAGSPRYLAQRVQTLATYPRTHNKVKPIFQPVDFNDLFDMLSFIMGTAIERTYQNNLTAFVELTCPLPASKVALMLRGAIAAITNKSMCSDMNDSASDFYPLQFPYAGANVATAVKTLILPFLVVENIRALAMVAVESKNKRAKDQLSIFAPVWGVYGREPRTNYNFQCGTAPSFINVYEPDTATYNMIECISTTDSTAFAVTGPELEASIRVWNEWINQFSAVCNLATFSTTTNTPALTSIIYQRGYVYNTPGIESTSQRTNPKSQSKEVKPKFEYKNLLKIVKSVNQGLINNEAEKYIASNVPIQESVYELISNWVLPKVLVESSSDVTVYTGNSVMPYIVTTQNSIDPINSSVVYPLLTSKWAAAASIATKQATAEDHELLQKLMELSRKGQGGFFGSAIGDFLAGATGIPLLSHLGSLIPF